MCHILLHFLIMQQSIALFSPQTFLKVSTLFISPCCFLGWYCSLWDIQNRNGGDGPKCSKFKWLGLTAVPPVAYAYAQMCGVYEWMCACMRRSVHALLESQRSIISTLLYPQEIYPTWGGTQHRRIYSSLEINVICSNDFLQQALGTSKEQDPVPQTAAQPQFVMLSLDPKATCSDEGPLASVCGLRQSKQMSVCCGLRG